MRNLREEAIATSRPSSKRYHLYSLIFINAGKKDGTYERRPRQGRPHKVTKSEIKYVILLIKRDHRITYDALVGSMGDKVSRTTIKRIVRTYYGRKWRAMQRIPISKATTRECLEFAQAWKGDEDELMEVLRFKNQALFWFGKVLLI